MENDAKSKNNNYAKKWITKNKHNTHTHTNKQKQQQNQFECVALNTLGKQARKATYAKEAKQEK